MSLPFFNCGSSVFRVKILRLCHIRIDTWWRNENKLPPPVGWGHVCYAVSLSPLSLSLYLSVLRTWLSGPTAAAESANAATAGRPASSGPAPPARREPWPCPRRAAAAPTVSKVRRWESRRVCVGLCVCVCVCVCVLCLATSIKKILPLCRTLLLFF